MNTRVITPARSARAGSHSIGSTLPLVPSVLTMVSRATLAKSTSGGAVLLVIIHTRMAAAPTSTIATQLRARLTGEASRNNRTEAATRPAGFRALPAHGAIQAAAAPAR